MTGTCPAGARDFSGFNFFFFLFLGLNKNGLLGLGRVNLAQFLIFSIFQHYFHIYSIPSKQNKIK